MSEDPIHQNSEGKWCFWLGLYETREEAEEGLAKYIRYLDEE